MPRVATQLDYLRVSRRLAAASPGLPRVERRGLPKRAGSVESFPGVGWSHPKASDHSALAFELVRWEPPSAR